MRRWTGTESPHFETDIFGPNLPTNLAATPSGGRNGTAQHVVDEKSPLRRNSLRVEKLPTGDPIRRNVPETVLACTTGIRGPWTLSTSAQTLL